MTTALATAGAAASRTRFSLEHWVTGGAIVTLIVLIVLIFFIATTTFNDETRLKVTLPEASIDQKASEIDSIELLVNMQGEYFINGKALINNQLLTKPFEVFFILAVIYFVVCWSLTWAATWLERRIEAKRAGLGGQRKAAAKPVPAEPLAAEP